jgi:hypothetical protein
MYISHIQHFNPLKVIEIQHREQSPESKSTLDKLTALGFALQYIHSYLDEHTFQHQKRLLTTDQLHVSQTDWLALLPKLTHPIDVQFFKPAWVPLEYDSFDWFADLNEDRLPVFEAIYLQHSENEYKWHRLEMFDSLTDMMICFEEGGKHLKQRIETVRLEQLDMLD